MQIPLQITFRDLPPTPTLEAQIRDWVDELQTFFDGIVSCRVAVEAHNRRHHQGGLYRVRIEIGVPGDRIVVGRSPDEHGAHADPYVSVRDAFRAARRELEDYARRLRGDVKAHAGPPHGHVIHLEPDLEYGRLAADDDGREIYFHRNSVVGGIEGLELGAEVRFHEERGQRGPQASTVELIGAHGHHTA